MIYSMTGYGQAVGEYLNKQIQVEIKSLNGKSTDIRMRVPNNYKEKELTLRSHILEAVKRGKLDFGITVNSAAGEDGYSLNKELFLKYYAELSDLHKNNGIDGGDLTQSIMRIPNVIMAEDNKLSDEEWKVALQTVDNAIKSFTEFRLEEGEAMKKDLKERIQIIESSQEKLKEFETDRIETVKARMRKNLESFLENEHVDENRFEQELIYYIEKLDITEEKVRLAQHCKFFKEILDNNTAVVGKKLNFITQEIGREINTLGAKSQHSDIQQIVVVMKDELEKVKEQLANIL